MTKPVAALPETVIGSVNGGKAGAGVAGGVAGFGVAVTSTLADPGVKAWTVYVMPTGASTDRTAGLSETAVIVYSALMSTGKPDASTPPTVQESSSLSSSESASLAAAAGVAICANGPPGLPVRFGIADFLNVLIVNDIGQISILWEQKGYELRLLVVTSD